MPFCISETRNSTARAAGRHVSDQELWTAMAGVRAEMEELWTAMAGKRAGMEMSLCVCVWRMRACAFPPPSVSTLQGHWQLVTFPGAAALRTLADQVRKRERTKKQLLKAWREQFLESVFRANIDSYP
eukprot:1159975-Pelagomonas_calceolata.AAC.1